jgi:hypothetical protein
LINKTIDLQIKELEAAGYVVVKADRFETVTVSAVLSNIYLDYGDYDKVKEYVISGMYRDLGHTLMTSKKFNVIKKYNEETDAEHFTLKVDIITPGK